MARLKRDPATNPTPEAADTPKGANDQQGIPLPPLVPQGVHVARSQPVQRSEFEPNPPPDPNEKPALPRQYRVTRGGRISGNGLPALLREGKVLDERSYNIELLRKQGIELELLT